MSQKTRLEFGWKAEWLKNGGDEMVKNLVSIYTRVKEERKFPNPWMETAIKSIYTGGKP